MSERPTTPSPEPKRRSVTSKLLELLFWAVIAVGTAWLMIENINTILPANNF